MPAIATRLDHHHRHARLANSGERVLQEMTPNPPLLIVGINSDDKNLAHVVVRVQASAHPSDWPPLINRDIDILRFIVKHFRQVLELPYAPSVRGVAAE